MLRGEFPVTRIAGLRLTYEENAVRYGKTVVANLRELPEAQRSVARLHTLVTAFRPDVVLSDFEPITALTAHLHRIPLISIDNQHQLTHTRIPFPLSERQTAIATQAVTRFMVPRARHYLVSAFDPQARATKPRTTIIPPILRDDVLRLRVRTHRSNAPILVYSTSNDGRILATLTEFPREHFLVYGLRRRRGSRKNYTIKAPSREEFLSDLVRAKAVIANAGFTLITEALYLGIPYLAIPIRAQYEQIINAAALSRLQFGAEASSIQSDAVAAFCYRIPEYTERLQTYPRHDNAVSFAEIDRLLASITSRPLHTKARS
jgi:uncharacterized protein (TIGR00661 family)